MRKILKAIDAINEFVGSTARWLAVFVMLVITTEVFLRFALNRPTIQLPEIMVMSGAALYTLSWGYIYLHQRHVRVDVFYTRLPTRGKATIDVVCGLLFLLPLVAFLAYAGWIWTWKSWLSGEKSPMTYWYPLVWPVRSVVFIGLVLLALQSFAQFFRDLHLLVRSKPYD